MSLTMDETAESGNASPVPPTEVDKTLEIRHLLDALKQAEQDLAKAQRSIHECMEKQTALRSQANASKQVAKAAASALAELEQERKEDAVWLSKIERFSFESILASCHEFQSPNFIGEGHSGTVFKGSLRGTPVAVKLFENSELGSYRKFLYEALAHSAMRHPNVVLLIGYCDHPQALIFEHLSNGSLHSQLLCKQGNRPLDWKIRFRMFLDICRALLYLDSRNLPNLCLELSSKNVLIDSHFNAKISNVAFSSSFDMKDPSGTKSAMRGSLRFVHSSPHIYSLGTILWDLLMKPHNSSSRIVLLSVFEAMDCKGIYDAEHLVEFLDPSAGDWPHDILLTLITTARDCCFGKGDHNSPTVKSIMESLMDFHHVLEHCPPFPTSKFLQSCFNASSKFGYVPEEFVCPISRGIMESPVVATDGYTYDHTSISEWLKTRYVSPKTGLPMFDKHLVPNHALRSMILDWEESQKSV